MCRRKFPSPLQGRRKISIAQTQKLPPKIATTCTRVWYFGETETENPLWVRVPPVLYPSPGPVPEIKFPPFYRRQWQRQMRWVQEMKIGRARTYVRKRIWPKTRKTGRKKRKIKVTFSAVISSKIQRTRSSQRHGKFGLSHLYSNRADKLHMRAPAMIELCCSHFLHQNDQWKMLKSV